MDTFECSCRGENPNCFKCGGTGLGFSKKHQLGRPTTPLGKTYLAEPSKLTVTSQREKVKAKDTFLSDAEIAGIAQRAYTKAKERIVKHREKLASEKFKKTDTSDWTVCPFCEAKVKKLDKHFRKSHTPEGREQKEKLKEQKKTKKQVKNRQVKTEVPQHSNQEFSEYRRLHPAAKLCGFCKGFFVNTDSLREHFRQVHPESGNTKPVDKSIQRRTHRVSNSGKSSPVKSNSKDSTQGHKIEDSKIERQMDATYGLGGFARDGGRFGSPATYDNMDDESFS